MTRTVPITLAEFLQRLPAGARDQAPLIQKAYGFAEQAHAGRRRESGELTIDHDLAVAQLVCELGMDGKAITAALLHDAPFESPRDREERLRKLFDEEVANLVAGLGRLDPYTTAGSGKDDQNLEKIRQAILTIVEGDLRVIIIKLADQLQDLRKAGDLPPARQVAVAQETMDLYAPLANRLGIWQLKWELEDLGFRYQQPEEYRRIAGQLAERRADRTRSVENAMTRLQQKLHEAGLQASVSGRPKHIYSIYRKMAKKKVDFDQIYDVRGLRIILEKNEPSLCYQALGIVHSLWQPVIPSEFDDYIAWPKPNGYQSLHTAVMDENGDTLEVQIRTQTMHEESEKGVAAHWHYKESDVQPALARRIQALRQQFVSALRETDDSEAAGETFKAEILAEHIYVFSPRGDVYNLPTGSTPIDFAYLIHSQVGHHCRGAKVNGKMVSLDYKLKLGDRVEIIKANRGGPNRDWMNESLGYTGSARTRSKIRQWFRQQEREHNIEQGRDIVNRELRRLGVNDVYTAEDIAQALKFDDVEQFLSRVGFGDVQAAQIGGAIAALQQKLKPDDELRQLLTTRPPSKGLVVRGISGLLTNMARCCNPIPPEPIVGYITRGRGVTIHRQDCNQVLAINEPERLIEAEWGTEEETFAIPIIIKAYDRAGLMGDIANILKAERVNLAKAKTATSNSLATIYLLAEVSTLDQLSWILNKVEKLPNVIEAQRQRWSD